ncbi:MAG: O-antigen ligase family protein [Candidatus Omnitrophica bacterium]|nr:O-antigen ligase family protein [Candidatus Omnitrophota bacterium]
MEITIIGLIILPLTLLLFMWKHNLSLVMKLTIFFVPFCALSVANFHIGSFSFGIGLDRYFAIILMASVAFLSIFKGYKGPDLPKKTRILFLLFILSILFSLIAPTYFKNILIWKRSGLDFFQAPLTFSYGNILKTAEILIVAFFFVSVYRAMPLVSSGKIARIIILSLVIISISALFDLLPVKQLYYSTGETSIIPIWTAVKNNISYSHMPFTGTGHFCEPRLSGLALEPSHLAICAIGGFAIMAAFYKNNTVIFQRALDFSLLIIFAFISILSFSPIMFIGFGIVLCYLCFKEGKLIVRRAAIVGLILLSAIILMSHLVGMNLILLTIKTIGEKLGFIKDSVNSSDFRAFCFFAAWNMFLKSPIIGIGWGTTGIDAGSFLYLLVSVGILGTSVFIGLMIRIFKLAAAKLKGSGNPTEKSLREGLMISFLIVTITCLFTKGPLYFFHLPLIFIAASMCSDYGKVKTVQ